MEKQSSSFKVIIIGGSIVGLTLAHCLDHAGIGYVLLEKHEDIQPQLGAFVGILPNSAQVLEQLGLYEKIEGISEPITVAHAVFPDGYTHTDYWPAQLVKRADFPLLVLSRHQFLGALYGCLRDKSKIRVKKKVVKVQLSESGVSVLTDDGECYDGDLVVGADGVHSVARSELWRIANEVPQTIPLKDRSALTSEYSLIFGIAKDVPGINPGEQFIRYHDQAAILAFGGKDGMVGWGAIQKLDQQYTYPDVPRFTQEDAIANAKPLCNLSLSKDASFDHIWERTVKVSMTAMEEGILQNWHHGRMVCIGDSVNKMSPNMAMGANVGIESAAALANVLHRLIRRKGASHEKPSDNEVSEALASLAQTQVGRFRTINYLSYLVTRCNASYGLIYRLSGRYIYPNIPGMVLYVLVKIAAGSVVLEYLPSRRSSQKQLGLLKSPKGMDSLNLAVIVIATATVFFLLSLLWPGVFVRTGDRIGN